MLGVHYLALLTVLHSNERQGDMIIRRANTRRSVKTVEGKSVQAFGNTSAQTLFTIHRFGLEATAHVTVKNLIKRCGRVLCQQSARRAEVKHTFARASELAK